MANKTVLVQNQVQAMNIDALNRSVINESTDIENGMVFRLDAVSATDGESEVFTLTAPATSYLNNCWMAYEPEITIVTVNGKSYKGLTPDPRDFINPMGLVFSAFKPVVGDIIVMTLGGALGTKGGSDTHINAANGAFALAWGTSQTASALSFKLLGTTYVSIADGTVGTQRVTAYRFECVGN